MPTPTIATRTEPIGIPSSCFCLVAVSSVADRSFGRGAGEPVADGSAGALGVDQVGEPAHFALDRLDPVPLQLGGVPVDFLLGHRQLVLHPVEPLLEPGTASLEHPQPDLHVGPAEEGEPDVEVVVLPRGRTDLGHQPLELRGPGVGELVDDARPPGDRRRRRRDLLDQGAAQHLLQGGVERPVGQHPTPAEHEVQPLAQLVAVHGSLVQQSEDCQLDGFATTCHATYRSDISGGTDPAHAPGARRVRVTSDPRTSARCVPCVADLRARTAASWADNRDPRSFWIAEWKAPGRRACQ